MDFDFDTSPANNEQNNPPEESKLTNLDQMLNMEFQPFPEKKKKKNDSNQINMDFTQNNITEPLQNFDNEEQKRIMDRQKDAEIRKQKINEKIKKEEELRIEIRKKAAEYLVEFEQKRQENIAQRRKSLEEKEKNKNEGNDTGNNSDSWKKINSNIDLKDSEYKGSKDVQRMREAMLNRKEDPNSEPLQHFFG